MMRLHDTAKGAVVAFAPGPTVTMYVCGITPYDATHLGHAFTFIAYDVLQRRLIDLGHAVRYVRNVTDVDDPLFEKARALGVDARALATREEARFEVDMAALGALPPCATPHVSTGIADIQACIRRLVEGERAYIAGGAVYGDVDRFPRFGEVSHCDRETMLALARARGGNVDDPNKRHPLDFVLWQPSAPDEPAWASPWGAGRPGWHVECSAFALRDLAPTIDLHGGGTDLVFPHHEYECAISEAVTGQPFVKHWMHVAMVWKDGHKMSKSLGNLVFIDDLRSRHDPCAIRLALLAHHYRAEWAWDDDLMGRAENRLARWRDVAAAAVDEPAVLDEVRAALDDDLDTPRAVAAIDAAVERGSGVRAAARLLGVSS